MPTGKEKSFKGYQLLIWLLMTLNLVWYQMMGYSEVFQVAADFTTVLPLERVCFQVTSLLGALACVLFGRTLQANRATLTPVVSSGLVLGIILFSLAKYQTILPQQLFASVGAALMGLCFALMFIAYMQLFKANGTLWEFVVLETLAMCAMRVILNVALRLSQELQVAVTIIAAVLLVVLLWIAQRRLDSSEKQITGVGLVSDWEVFRSSRSIQLQFVILTVISVATVIMRVTAVTGTWGSGRGGVLSIIDNLLIIVVSTLIFAVVTLAVFYLYIKRRNWRFSQFSFLVLIAGFFLIVTINSQGDGGVLAVHIQTTVELYCQTLYLFTIVYSMRSLPFLSYRVSGFALALPSLISLVWTLFFENIGPGISLFILLGSYLLVILLVMMGGRGVKQLSKNADVEGDESPLYANVVLTARSIADSQGLTERETEIFSLLAQGRSLPYIQKELTISEGTVRTHVKHIYVKLDIHSRQELLDLFQ